MIPTIVAARLIEGGVLALAIGSTSLTLTKSHLLEGLRSRVRPRSPWLANGLGCPYCAAHWLAGGAAWFVMGLSPWAETWAWAISTMALVSASTLLMGLMTRLLLIGEAEHRAEVIRLEDENLLLSSTLTELTLAHDHPETPPTHHHQATGDQAPSKNPA